MTIHIEDLSFEVIIGLLDFERLSPQRVIIQLEALYPYEKDIFIDYAEMSSLIQEHLLLKRYMLLEEALLGLSALLSSQYPPLQKLFIKISKPDILNNCRVSLSKTWQF